MKFLLCKHCNNIIIFMHESGVTPVCCGEEMHAIVPGEIDGSLEKHVPIVRDVRGIQNSTEKCDSEDMRGTGGDDKQGANSNITRIVTVEVGESAHPMMKEHYIQWILLETDCGIYVTYLNPEDAPKASFRIDPDERIMAVYSYCNLHGLWKAIL